MAKKQSKADKAFIAKIATIGIKTSTSASLTLCQDCLDSTLKQVGLMFGHLGGMKISGQVYGHKGSKEWPTTPRRRSAKRRWKPSDEQSLSA